MRKLLVNLCGSPGSGKTVTATSLFSQLKKKNMDCLLISEAATDFVIESNIMALKNQFFVWSNQSYRIFCAHEHATIVITDSPLILGLIYQQDASLATKQVILEHHRKYNNFNILVKLDHERPYSMTGRIHTEYESSNIQSMLLDILEVNHIPYLPYEEYDESEIVDLIIAATE